MDYANLINKIINGDRNAMAELYKKTYKHQYVIAKSYLKEDEDVKDILQDVYIKAFKNLPTLKNANKFETWLERITKHKCIDYIKSKKHYTLFSNLSIDDDYDDNELKFLEQNLTRKSTSFDLEDTVIADDVRKEIMKQIDTLSDEQRICFTSFVVNEMKISEIACMLNVPENTVKSRISYAKKRLQQKIEELENKGYVLRGVSDISIIPFVKYLFELETIVIPPLSYEFYSALTQQSSNITGNVINNLDLLLDEKPIINNELIINEVIRNNVTTSSIETVTKSTSLFSILAAPKIIAPIIAVGLSFATVAGVNNPEILQSIDVFNLFENTPIETLERFEKSFNNTDTYGMIKCLDFKLQEDIDKGVFERDKFLSNFFEIDTDGAIKGLFRFENMKCDLSYIEDNSIIEEEYALINSNIVFSISNEDIDVIEANIGMKKIDNKWYICNQEELSEFLINTNVIPEGCLYFSKIDSIYYYPGEKIPEPKTGDIFTTPYYEYHYNEEIDKDVLSNQGYTGDWIVWEENESNGWSVRVIDDSLERYIKIYDSIGSKPVVNMNYTFARCKRLKEAPQVSYNSITLEETFYGCENMEKAEIIIPEFVQNMEATFMWCGELNGNNN